MNYKDKLRAAQDKAYYRNIATKIDRDMSELRTQVESSPTTPRRWIWELLQNARDVHSESGVRVEIKLEPEQQAVVFKHSGKPFTADNIRFLIEQISSKEREKDEEGKRKLSGKFGTGFLTTHLLSEIVTVNGVAKEPELDYKQFKLVLDRSGQDLDDIIQSVEGSTISVENLDELPVNLDYKEGHFNTSFFYPLQGTTQVEVAKKGLRDLQRCLPYTLAFVEEISDLRLLPSDEFFQNSEEIDLLQDLFKVVSITKTVAQNEKIVFEIATVSKEFTTIAVPIKREDGITRILPIDENIPRLFCDFPLVGTEAFPFPIIINNPHFNPTEPRDGILLTGGQQLTQKVSDNREILDQAVGLYFSLLEYAAQKNWRNLHLLANIQPVYAPLRWISKDWFNDFILEPIRSQLLKAKIVNIANDGNPVAILKEDGQKYVWFPSSARQEIRQKIWNLANQWFPWQIPQKSDVDLWFKLSWSDCGKLTTDQFAEFVESKGSLSELADVLKKDTSVIEWLNDFYELLEMEEKAYDAIINKREIFPNQNGDFCKKQQLNPDAGDIEDDFKEILTLLGNDVKAELADPDIKINFSEGEIIDRSSVVKEISSEVAQKSLNRDLEQNHREAFNKLLQWFNKNQEEARSLFLDIYNRKHILYDEEVIMENIDKAEQLDDLLKDNGVANLFELKELIQKGQHSNGKLLPVTQEIIASMGITSVEEWEKALEDKDLAALFDHESIPTTDMFVFAQSHISKAKMSIIRHLEGLPNYDTSNLEETALTVLAGIVKDHREIQVVVRPAYRNQVIIYYQPELDVLDYVDSELWVDNGSQQSQISLGHVLRKAQIKKFPI